MSLCFKPMFCRPMLSPEDKSLLLTALKHSKTRAELARQLQISVSTIYCWLNNMNKPRREMLSLLAIYVKKMEGKYGRV